MPVSLGTYCKFLESKFYLDAVDGRNPAPPVIYEIL